eukprot:8443018-Pyramimonas_sp.AAC.1
MDEVSAMRKRVVRGSYTGAVGVRSREGLQGSRCFVWVWGVSLSGGGTANGPMQVYKIYGRSGIRSTAGFGLQVHRHQASSKNQ